jgi:hypothetical protein
MTTKPDYAELVERLRIIAEHANEEDLPKIAAKFVEAADAIASLQAERDEAEEKLGYAYDEGRHWHDDAAAWCLKANALQSQLTEAREALSAIATADVGRGFGWARRLARAALSNLQPAGKDKL